jgi:hypothetical protein
MGEKMHEIIDSILVEGGNAIVLIMKVTTTQLRLLNEEVNNHHKV